MSMKTLLDFNIKGVRVTYEDWSEDFPKVHEFGDVIAIYPILQDSATGKIRYEFQLDKENTGIVLASLLNGSLALTELIGKGKNIIYPFQDEVSFQDIINSINLMQEQYMMRGGEKVITFNDGT